MAHVQKDVQDHLGKRKVNTVAEKKKILLNLFFK